MTNVRWRREGPCSVSDVRGLRAREGESSDESWVKAIREARPSRPGEVTLPPGGLIRRRMASHGRRPRTSPPLQWHGPGRATTTMGGGREARGECDEAGRRSRRTRAAPLDAHIEEREQPEVLENGAGGGGVWDTCDHPWSQSGPTPARSSLAGAPALSWPSKRPVWICFSLRLERGPI